jgi:hypothetical protein
MGVAKFEATVGSSPSKNLTTDEERLFTAVAKYRPG